MFVIEFENHLTFLCFNKPKYDIYKIGHPATDFGQFHGNYKK